MCDIEGDKLIDKIQIIQGMFWSMSYISNPQFSFSSSFSLCPSIESAINLIFFPKNL